MVFSFGILIGQLVTGLEANQVADAVNIELAFSGIKDSETSEDLEGRRLKSEGSQEESSLAEQKPLKKRWPLKIRWELLNLVQRSLNVDPALRPSFASVSQCLFSLE